MTWHYTARRSRHLDQIVLAIRGEVYGIAPVDDEAGAPFHGSQDPRREGVENGL